MGSAMAFNKRETAGLRAAGTGALKCSPYRSINQPLEFSCICYQKEIWQAENGNRFKDNKQGDPTNGFLQSGIPLPSLLLKEWSITVIDLIDCFCIIPLQEQEKEKSSSKCTLIIILIM